MPYDIYDAGIKWAEQYLYKSTIDYVLILQQTTESGSPLYSFGLFTGVGLYYDSEQNALVFPSDVTYYYCSYYVQKQMLNAPADSFSGTETGELVGTDAALYSGQFSGTKQNHYYNYVVTQHIDYTTLDSGISITDLDSNIWTNYAGFRQLETGVDYIDIGKAIAPWCICGAMLFSVFTQILRKFG